VSKRIDQLREAVETMHHCKAVHEQSFPIVEMFGQQKVWEGVIESFAITGHPNAKRCYAWGYPDGGEMRYVAVLEIPPVDSPHTALRAAIITKAQK